MASVGINPAARRSQSPRQGLSIESEFCPTHVADPFDTVEWETRSAAIKDENGEVLFEQTDCEIPATWSQLATNVVVSKYFYGENGTPERETSVRQLIHRVTRTIADWGIADGYFATAEDGERFYRDLTWLCLHQHGAFNSPVWFNVGLLSPVRRHGGQVQLALGLRDRVGDSAGESVRVSAGFGLLHSERRDNMEDIMRLATSEAMLFKFGSGTGTDLSTIRSQREKLSGGGKPSGPLSFMRVYDQIAAVVKSGGKTRRAAKMQSLKVWHPDILEFIECKWKEEQKAHVLIEKGGYEANFNGEAYSSILFQNANLSVRVTDEFMQTVASRAVTGRLAGSRDTQATAPTYEAPLAAESHGRVCLALRRSGRAVRHDDQSLAHLPELGSHQRQQSVFGVHVPGRHGLQSGQHQLDEVPPRRRRVRCRAVHGRLPPVLHRPGDPGRSRQLSDRPDRGQQPSLPTAGIGLFESGQPDHVQRPAVRFGRRLRDLRSHDRHAARRGESDQHRNGGGGRPLRRVRREPRAVPARDANASRRGRGDQRRRARLPEGRRPSVLGRVLRTRPASTASATPRPRCWRPTGTISFMMDCDTTGIEPDIALVKYKQLAGGGMLKIVNQRRRGRLDRWATPSSRSKTICDYVDEHDTIEGAPHLQDEHLPVFDCAFKPANGVRSIAWQAHVPMMAAAQPFLSGAISKTVNMPESTPPPRISPRPISGDGNWA